MRVSQPISLDGGSPDVKVHVKMGGTVAGVWVKLRGTPPG